MTRFAHRIRPSIQSELAAARQSEAQGDPAAAFRHLERAHVLGQAVTVEHLRVHWRMFLWAIKHRKAAEALGQSWRLLAAALMTPIGQLPVGNTGGAKVSAFRRMPIPPDLQRSLDAAQR